MVDFVRECNVPKTLHANLEWRLNLRKKAARDSGLRNAIKLACKHDFLYYLNAWAWLHEPRERFDERGKLLPRVFPFLTWPHQDEKFAEVRRLLGIKDIGVEKCRGEGWTWFECWAAIQFNQFEDMSQVGLVSSTEKKSDSPNMGSILGKVDWAMSMLPAWIVGVKGHDRNSGDWYRNQSDHALVNLRNGAQINAFAASPDTGRGDRFTWFGLDEHASDEWKAENKDARVLDAIRGATDSILYISTPKGAYGAFHSVMKSDNNVHKVYIDWRDNPTKNRGLYQMVDGKPVAVDPVNNPLPEDYQKLPQHTLDLFSRLRKNGFDLDKGTRSPWLDRECDRGASPQSIAQEHERDYGGATVLIFGDGFMKRAEEGVREPDTIGELSVFDDLTYSFDRVSGGSFRLWCPLDASNRPPAHKYIICADIATGEGGQYCSNSALHVIDVTTREQVLEFATKVVKPVDFADKAIAIAKWFHGAYLAWEHMGPGTAFTTRVIEQGYGYCYERTTTDRKTRKSVKRLGYLNKGEAREALFADLEKRIRSAGLVIRSRQLLEEFPQYVREGKVIRHVSTKADDHSHGDRVIALGVGVQALKDLPAQKSIVGKPDTEWRNRGEPPEGTLAHIIWQQENHAARKDLWDHRSAADMARTDLIGSSY